MLKRIVCAGLGGQGVLTQGKILMHAAYEKGLKFTWFPAYGNEMRGGNAISSVIISDAKIANPYADHPDILLAMSESAVVLYMDAMAEGGLLVVNSSLVPEDKKYRNDVTVVKVPVTEIAQQMNSERNANLVMLGVLVKASDMFTIDEFQNAMCAYFEEMGKGKFNDKNKEMIRAGYDYKF